MIQFGLEKQKKSGKINYIQNSKTKKNKKYK